MLVLNPTHRKHFYDNHCQIVGDAAERQELERIKREEAEKLRQAKREELENQKQVKREETEKLRQAKKEETEKLRQAKKEELEKLKQRKRDEKQAKREGSDRLSQENGERSRVRRRIIETTAPKKKTNPKKNMDVIQNVFKGYREFASGHLKDLVPIIFFSRFFFY